VTDTIAPAAREEALLAEIAALRQRLDQQEASAQAEQARLTYELGHRVKNTLGVVQALASQTLRTAASPQDAIDSLSHRILALANANDVILKDGWTTAGLRTVATRVLEPHGTAIGPLSITGPDLRIDAGAALSFCMALHELASNARRHGAWSLPGGRVELSWAVEDDRLRLDWVEQGGPPVEPPAKRRFGLRLVEQSLRSAFGRDLALAFDADGFKLRVSAPAADFTPHA
jgi:two-component sensor histidine kinase